MEARAKTGSQGERPGALAGRWAVLREREPRLRIRDAASLLGVSELELLVATDGAAAADSTSVTWLTPRFAELLQGLPQVGRCMALTRNPHAVIEVKGRYGGVELGAHAGQVLGEGVDLRVFLSHWRHALALTSAHPTHPGRERRSLQFFDDSGTALHKVYLEPHEDPARWEALVQAHLRPSTPLPELTAPVPPPRPRSDFDEQARLTFCAAWEAMTDTHELFGLLRAHRLTRVQALQAVWPAARPPGAAHGRWSGSWPRPPQSDYA